MRPNSFPSRWAGRSGRMRRILVIVRPGIRFENVSFHYGRPNGVIDDFSLAIEPGEKVGIVGRSGRGSRRS